MRIFVAAAALSLLLAATSGGAFPRSAGEVVGEQRIGLVLATWGPEPIAVEEARAAVAETVSYIRDASFGKTSLSVEVIGWTRALPRRPRGCNTQGVHETIRRSVDLARFTLVAYLIPSMDCPWGGAYYPPGVWMLGKISKDLFAHELGHNYGVREEGPAWICGTSCRAQNYASPYSVMGHGGGHFDAFEKWRFGWIAREGPALANGEYRISRIDRPSALPHALYVVSGADEYWIEYRPEVPWPVVHAGANDARVAPSRFPQRNLLLASARSAKFSVRNAFEVVMLDSDPAHATLRFRWIDRTRPSRPRIDAIASGRWVTLSFPATDTGSGVDRYEVSIGPRHRVSVATTEVVDGELSGHEAFHRAHLPRGAHRVVVTAVDRAGNRGPAAVRVVRVR